MVPDYYALLGVSADADTDEVRRAYRKKAFELHPDRNGGSAEAEEAFKAVTEAYAVLSDAPRRAAFDASRRRGSPGGGSFAPEDLFAELFKRPEFTRVFQSMATEFREKGIRLDEAYFRRVLRRRGPVVFGGFFFAGSVADLLGLLGGFRRRAPFEPGAGASPRPPRKPGLLRHLLGSALPRPRERDAHDVRFDVSLQADLLEHGGKIRVVLPLDRGREVLEVRVPAGVRPGTLLRLRGRGKGPSSGRGDLYLRLGGAKACDDHESRS